MEALLHERRGGWADAMQTVRHLAERARAAGAEIREDVEVIGFEPRRRGASRAEADVECETVVACPGPWVEPLWALLGLDPVVEMDGERRPLVTYLKAQEGEFALEGAGLSGVGGREAPVVHLDQAGPLRSDRDGRVLVDGPWGIYFRMGRTGTGITGGGLPVFLDGPPSSTPTARTIPSTRPSRSSRSSSSRAWPPRCAASAAAPATGA